MANLSQALQTARERLVSLSIVPLGEPASTRQATTPPERVLARAPARATVPDAVAPRAPNMKSVRSAGALAPSGADSATRPRSTVAQHVAAFTFAPSGSASTGALLQLQNAADASVARPHTLALATGVTEERRDAVASAWALPLASAPPATSAATAGSKDTHVRVGVRVRPLIYTEVHRGVDAAQAAWVIQRPSMDDRGVDANPSDSTTVVEQEAEDPIDGSHVGGAMRGQVFRFRHVFGQGTNNGDVYGALIEPIVAAAAGGVNGTIFAYGQTSSGKTHTIMGGAEDPGVLVQALHHLFQVVATRSAQCEFVVRVSYVEIYNEVIRDLLDRSNVNLRIVDDPLRGPCVRGATERLVHDVDDVLATVAAGEANRHFGATAMNERSSRSHTVFRFNIECRALGSTPSRSAATAASPPHARSRRASVAGADADTMLRASTSLFGGARARSSSVTSVASTDGEGVGSPSRAVSDGQGDNGIDATLSSPGGTSSAQASGSGDGTVTVSVLNIIDLAGSERVGKTGATGDRLEEAKHINKSLHTLGNVIAALSLRSQGKKAPLPPFRDSKLTRLLSQSLGGNSLTALICCASPAPRNREETRSTLEFATRAQMIVTRARVNTLHADKSMMSAYRDEIDNLRRQLDAALMLQTQLSAVLQREQQMKVALERKDVLLAATDSQRTAMLAQIAELEAQYARERLQSVFPATARPARSRGGQGDEDDDDGGMHGEGARAGRRGGGSADENAVRGPFASPAKAAAARRMRQLFRTNTISSLPVPTLAPSARLATESRAAAEPPPLSRMFSASGRRFMEAIEGLRRADDREEAAIATARSVVAAGPPLRRAHSVAGLAPSVPPLWHHAHEETSDTQSGAPLPRSGRGWRPADAEATSTRSHAYDVTAYVEEEEHFETYGTARSDIHPAEAAGQPVAPLEEPSVRTSALLRQEVAAMSNRLTEARRRRAQQHDEAATVNVGMSNERSAAHPRVSTSAHDDAPVRSLTVGQERQAPFRPDHAMAASMAGLRTSAQAAPSRAPMAGSTTPTQAPLPRERGAVTSTGAATAGHATSSLTTAATASAPVGMVADAPRTTYMSVIDALATAPAAAPPNVTELWLQVQAMQKQLGLQQQVHAQPVVPEHTGLVRGIVTAHTLRAQRAEGAQEVQQGPLNPPHTAEAHARSVSVSSLAPCASCEALHTENAALKDRVAALEALLASATAEATTVQGHPRNMVQVVDASTMCDEDSLLPLLTTSTEAMHTDAATRCASADAAGAWSTARAAAAALHGAIEEGGLALAQAAPRVQEALLTTAAYLERYHPEIASIGLDEAEGLARAPAAFVSAETLLASWRIEAAEGAECVARARADALEASLHEARARTETLVREVEAQLAAAAAQRNEYSAERAQAREQHVLVQTELAVMSAQLAATESALHRSRELCQELAAAPVPAPPVAARMAELEEAAATWKQRWYDAHRALQAEYDAAAALHRGFARELIAVPTALAHVLAQLREAATVLEVQLSSGEHPGAPSGVRA